MYSIITLVSSYFWYRFMVGYYMNGRILDLYRRLSGTYKAFFIPMDHEVSLKYLQWVITRAKKRDYAIVSEQRLIKDKFGIQRKVNFIQILKIEKGMLKKNRLFFKDFDGSIIEVPQKKIFVRTKELKQIKRMNTTGGVNVYYDEKTEQHFELNGLCRNTNDWIRGHRAVGVLKDQEDEKEPFGLDVGAGEIIEEIPEPVSTEKKGHPEPNPAYMKK